MAALAALALALSTGTGNLIGGTDLMLQSIVAVVLGGTRLSGGQGGVVGSIIGVVILSLIQSIVSFSPALLVADPDQRPDRGGGPRRSRPFRPPQAG